MLAIFKNGATLKMLFDFFSTKPERAYRKLAEMIKQKLRENYED